MPPPPPSKFIEGKKNPELAKSKYFKMQMPLDQIKKNSIRHAAFVYVAKC